MLSCGMRLNMATDKAAIVRCMGAGRAPASSLAGHMMCYPSIPEERGSCSPLLSFRMVLAAAAVGFGQISVHLARTAR